MATSQVRTILDKLSSVIVATGAGLRPCTYRRPIELEPRDGTHRRFELLATGTKLSPRGLFGGGYTATDLTLRVRMYYSRPGGDAGGGDRKSINELAGEDGIRIANCLQLPENWNQDLTAIRVVAPSSISRVIDGKDFEVWEVQVFCEVSVVMPLPVGFT